MDRIEKDEEQMFHESMQNAYLLVTKQLTFNDLL